MTETGLTWMSWGSVRGGCGHAHRTKTAAERCLDRDARGCAQQGGYSDRAAHLTACGWPSGYSCGCPVGVDEAAAARARHYEVAP